MHVEIRTRTFPLTDSLREHCERRLTFALGPFEDHLERVVVRLEDLNGPKGGYDKRCRVVLTMRGTPPVTVQSTGVNLYAAIDDCGERVARAVERAVGRARTRSRGELLKAGAPS